MDTRHTRASATMSGVRQPRIVFVSSPYQNAFFAELTQALLAALDTAGIGARVTHRPGDHRVDADDVFVLMPPHEYVTLEGSGFVDDPVVAARTIGISAEQPHQVFFDRNAAVASKLGAVLDFSPLAVQAYRNLGIEAAHQPFGYVPAWDRFGGGPRPEASLTTEVLYLGNKRPRRLGALAEAADALVRHRATLVVSDNAEPNRRTTPSFLAGDDKRDLLASTRLLVNIHQGDEPYFEWLRFADAVHCGTPVLTERSMASEPFVDGTHYLSFAEGHLGRRLDEVLADPARLCEVAAAAYDLLRQRPLDALVGPLVEAATALSAAPAPDRLPPSVRTAPLGRDRADPDPKAQWRPPRRTALHRAVRRAGDGGELLAPPGTTFREPLTLQTGDHLVSCIADGHASDGHPTLEGIWPWEPWRLRHGQHLGRVLAVDADLLAATRRWISEPWVDDHLHLAVQLFAVVHGVTGRHVARPIATLHGVAADPEHTLPAGLAERCRQILG